MVELVRPGKVPDELAREFEPTAQSMWTWVKLAERDAGKQAIFFVKSVGYLSYDTCFRRGAALQPANGDRLTPKYLSSSIWFFLQHEW
jgi:hypothetical protein